MRLPWRHSLPVAVVALIASAGPARAGDDKPKRDKPQKTEGVVTKVEELPRSGDKSAPRRVCLTIKTDAVWRDFVRDQANVKPDASNKKAAKEGKEGIAAKGEPADAASVVVVELCDDTKLETRFRAAIDETNAGSKTAAEAEEKAGEGRRESSSAKPPKTALGDLKPGLFVQVEYHRQKDKNEADCVAVLRPVGGPQSPPKEEVERK